MNKPSNWIGRVAVQSVAKAGSRCNKSCIAGRHKSLVTNLITSTVRALDV